MILERSELSKTFSGLRERRLSRALTLTSINCWLWYLIFLPFLRLIFGGLFLLNMDLHIKQAFSDQFELNYGWQTSKITLKCNICSPNIFNDLNKNIESWLQTNIVRRL